MTTGTIPGIVDVNRDELVALLHDFKFVIASLPQNAGVHIIPAKGNTFSVQVASKYIPNDLVSKHNLGHPSRFGYDFVDLMDEVQFILMQHGYYAHRSGLNSVHVISRSI
jgi:hypothetical protein